MIVADLDIVGVSILKAKADPPLIVNGNRVLPRAIVRACRDNVLFIAITGDARPHFTTIAAFVSRSRNAIAAMFAQVLAILGKEGLIGREMFAIDGVKLPSNASKHRSGTRVWSANGEEMLAKIVRVRAAPSINYRYLCDNTLRRADGSGR